jgi:tetratricopeptide (TPR) repeat protein
MNGPNKTVNRGKKAASPRPAVPTLGLFLGLGLLTLTPAVAHAYINAGFRSEGDYRKYLKYEEAVHKATNPFTEAIQRDPKDAVAHYQRARAWDGLPLYTGPWPDRMPEERLNRDVQALRDYDRAVELDPSFTRAYLRRAAVLWRTGRYGRALDDLKEAARLDPKAPLAHAYLASAYAGCPEERHRDADRAAEHARKACELSGYADAACLQVLAAVSAQGGDFEAAVKWQRNAAERLSEADADAPVRQRLRAYEKKRPNPSAFTFAELEEASKRREKR